MNTPHPVLVIDPALGPVGTMEWSKALVLHMATEEAMAEAARRGEDILPSTDASGKPIQYVTVPYDHWQETEDGDPVIVRSAHMEHLVPSVVILKRPTGRRPTKRKWSRANCYDRDAGRCQYCGRKVERNPDHPNGGTLDHVVPRAQGGKTEWENIVLACKDCNFAKGNRTPEQAGMRMLSGPRQPPMVGTGRLVYRDWMPPAWRPWMERSA